MPIKELPGGGYAIVCSRNRQPKKCSVCKTRDSERLCDGTLPTGKTCDAPLCRLCSKSPRVDVDYCPAHAPVKEGSR